MESKTPHRAIFRIHALLIGVAGIILLSRRPHVSFTQHTQSASVTILHLIAITMTVSATFARALSFIEDPASRRRASFWFLAGQWISAAILLAKHQAIFDGQFPTWPLAIYLTGLLLVTLWHIQEGRESPGLPIADLRSRNESEIRLAAGREERHRLARDLHDAVKQHVFAIHTAAATAQEAFESKPEAAAQAIGQVRTSARDAMSEMNTMLDQLQAEPFSPEGLTASFDRLCETTRLRSGAETTLDIRSLPPAAEWVPGAAGTLFRIAQEALSNVSRHARASDVKVILEGIDGGLSLTVKDNGRGFDASSGAACMGLRNIRSRAEEAGGRAVVDSGPEGTSVRVSLPRPRAARSLKGMHMAAALLLAALALLWSTTGSAGNSLRPPLMAAVAAACAIHLSLHAIRYFREGDGE
jgi:signal transduction histidine kinase